MIEPLEQPPNELGARSLGVVERLACRICGCTDGQIHQASERMFGTGEVFEYFQCAACGCLQIGSVPDDLARHYGPSYYSLDTGVVIDEPAGDRRWRQWMRRRRNQHQLFRKGIPWHLLARGRTSSRVEWIREWYRGCPVHSLDVRVLDVGCGNADRLKLMASIGFRELVGIDPFLSKEGSTDGRIGIHKAQLASFCDQPFDVIMLHHSLEHMDDHASVFYHISRLLKPHGACLVRIPLASSNLLDRYGDAWAEWDPPRHLYLHTLRSLSQVVEAAGLAIVNTLFDSTAFCYWASELYRRGIPLMDERSNRFRAPENYFTDREMATFTEQAEEANLSGASSRGAFWIQHHARGQAC